MLPHLAHVFVDGGHLRSIANDCSVSWPNPRTLAENIVRHPRVQEWASNPASGANTVLGRVTYYDARPDSEQGIPPDLRDYWAEIELLSDTQLGFGALRGDGKRRRQKKVDTLIAVDMLVGAVEGIFDVAVLVSADSDFVPVIEEVKRRGAMTVVAAREESVADDLRRAADRFIAIGHGVDPHRDLFPRLAVNDRTWPTR